MNANAVASIVPAVNHYGEFTAKLLQHQEWRQQALREAELRRAFEPARGGATTPDNLPALRRVSAAFGVQLVRLGTRLQGTGSPVAQSAC
jgi:hypothetical protein